MGMKILTKQAGILYAYFCESTTRLITFIFTPLGMFFHYCLGGDRDSWRERRKRSLKVVLPVIANRTPIMTWVCLSITLIFFWAKILEKYVFFEDHKKVSYGSMMLFAVSILPFVVWWINNRDFIKDVKNNLCLGEKNRILYTLTALLFFILQIVAPFLVLCFPL